MVTHLRNPMRHTPRWAATAMVLALLFALVPAAQAASGRPSDGSALSEYVPSVPSSEGAVTPAVATPPGTPVAGGQPVPFTPSASRSLGRVSKATGAQLRRLATTPSLGAPTRPIAVARPALTADDPSLSSSLFGDLPAGAILVLLAVAGGLGAALTLRFRRR